MKDYLLTPDGDLYIDAYGDIALTDSVSQAILSFEATAQGKLLKEEVFLDV